ncbi:hypothetical protein HP547_25320 [Pseudomonas sp. CrR7]|nr:hypothetical protein [Pseudomonas sp. CM27]
MSQLIEQTSLYEILIRVREDGSYGAHYQTITRVLRDGERFGSASEGPLVPLVEGDSEAFALFGQYVGSATADTLAANQALQGRVSELEQARDSLAGELQQALDANQVLQARVLQLENQLSTPPEEPSEVEE